jgi:hypothetical protein
MEQDLERRIQALERKMEHRERQQLSFPLDGYTDSLIRDKKLMFEREATGTITADKTLIVSINGKLYKINVL